MTENRVTQIDRKGKLRVVKARPPYAQSKEDGRPNSTDIRRLRYYLRIKDLALFDLLGFLRDCMKGGNTKCWWGPPKIATVLRYSERQIWNLLIKARNMKLITWNEEIETDSRGVEQECNHYQFIYNGKTGWHPDIMAEAKQWNPKIEEAVYQWNPKLAKQSRNRSSRNEPGCSTYENSEDREVMQSETRGTATGCILIQEHGKAGKKESKSVNPVREADPTDRPRVPLEKNMNFELEGKYCRYDNDSKFSSKPHEAGPASPTDKQASQPHAKTESASKQKPKPHCEGGKSSKTPGPYSGPSRDGHGPAVPEMSQEIGHSIAVMAKFIDESDPSEPEYSIPEGYLLSDLANLFKKDSSLWEQLQLSYEDANKRRPKWLEDQIKTWCEWFCKEHWAKGSDVEPAGPAIENLMRRALGPASVGIPDSIR